MSGAPECEEKDEIEITPAMIEVGAAVLESFVDDNQLSSLLVKEILIEVGREGNIAVVFPPSR